MEITNEEAKNLYCLPDNLRFLRKTLKKTQLEFSHLCEVTLQTYKKYEQNAHRPSYEALFKIKTVSNLTSDALLYSNLQNIKDIAKIITNTY